MELVDTASLNGVARKGVRVRVPPSVQKGLKYKNLDYMVELVDTLPLKVVSFDARVGSSPTIVKNAVVVELVDTLV